MQYNIHPYLIATSYYHDYSTVVCPTIFDRHFHLDKATDREPLNGKIGVRKVIDGENAFHIVYKREKIIKPNSLDEIALDHTGTPLNAHYGFIIKDDIKDKPLTELLDEVKSELRPYLEKFLETEGIFKVVRTDKVFQPDIADHACPTASDAIVILPDYIVPAKKHTLPNSKEEDVVALEKKNLKSGQNGRETFGKSGTNTRSTHEVLKEPRNPSTIAKVGITLALGVLLCDGAANLIYGYKEEDADKKKSKMIRGTVEAAASIAGIVFAWRSKAFDGYLNDLFKTSGRST